jgi:hypothetical protein
MNNKKAVAVFVASVDSVVMERNASSKSNTIDCTLAQPTLLGFRKTDTATKTADGNLVYGNDRVGEEQKQAQLADCYPIILYRIIAKILPAEEHVSLCALRTPASAY